MITSKHGFLILTVLLVSVASFASSKSKDKNLSFLNEGRVYYQKGNFTKALEAYNKVEKESDFWVDALEEKAWVHTRNKDHSKALAELKSILNPVFIPMASSEALMLAAFVDLKICNYRGVAEKIPLFKQHMLPRVEALEALVQNPRSELATQWIQKMKEKPLTAADVGKDITKLPRYFYRDTKLAKNPSRMKKLAQDELAEISKNLKKMKIIEIELIHRTQISDVRLAQDKDLIFDKENSKDALIFPVKDGSSEIWLDEIGKFQVETTECPTDTAQRGSL